LHPLQHPPQRQQLNLQTYAQVIPEAIRQVAKNSTVVGITTNGNLVQRPKGHFGAKIVACRARADQRSCAMQRVLTVACGAVQVAGRILRYRLARRVTITMATLALDPRVCIQKYALLTVAHAMIATFAGTELEACTYPPQI